MRPIRWCAATVVVISTAVANAATPAGTGDYVDGLEALGAGKWDDAAGKFAKALDADEENASYYTARGVAEALGEKLDKAAADFKRALKLRPNDAEARMWSACVTGMQADFMHSSDAAPAAKFGDEYFNTIRRTTTDYGQASFREQQVARDVQQGYNAASAAEDRQQIAALREGAKARFPKLAQMFVEKVESTSPEIAKALGDRAGKQLANGDAAGAARALDRVRQANPDDPKALLDHATAMLGTGAPAVARREATLFLIQQPNRADGYLLRAKAAAMMGDERRTHTDLATARSLDAKAADGAAAGIEQACKENAAGIGPGDGAGAVAELRDAAKTAKTPELAERAMRVVHAANEGRLVADEAYQDKMLALLRPIWKDARDAGAYANLGDFMYRNSGDGRGEKVEPRAEFHPYRTVSEKTRERELSQAQWCADEALKRDPRNVHAMGVKAAVLERRGQGADAEALLRQAMAIKGDDPDVLALFAQIMDEASGMRNANASNLRETKTWSDVAYIYTRWPSESELRRADQLEAQANALWEIGSEQLTKAAAVTRGTARGFYLQSILARRNSDTAGMRAALEQAVKLAPDDADYHEQLGALCAETGDGARAFDEKVAAVRLTQTTAGPFLRVAWSQIPMTKFATARKLLESAIAADPADPRGPAYMGVVAAAKGNDDEAIAWMRAAYAIREAGARLEGLAGDGPLRADQAAFGVALANRTGEMMLANDRAAEAQGAYETALGLCKRVPVEQWWARQAAGMLPDVETETGVIPEAMPLAALAGWAKVGRGRAYMAQGKLAEAEREFAAVEGLQHIRPPTVDVGTTLNWPTFAARLDLVEVAVRAGRTDQARQRMMMYGFPRGVSAAEEKHFQELQQKVNGR